MVPTTDGPCRTSILAQRDKEEDVVCNETTTGQDLNGEEVCPGKGGDEVRPTRALAAFRRWSDAVPLQNIPDRLI